MIIYARPCPDCGARVRLEIATDRHGHSLPDKLVDGCEHERKRRGVCKHCPRPVYGKVGQCLYCAPCRLEAKRKQARNHARKKYHADPEADRARVRAIRERNAEKYAAKTRAYYEANRSVILAKKRARARWNNPKYQADLARRRERYANDPELRARVTAANRERRARRKAEREQRKAA